MQTARVCQGPGLLVQRPIAASRISSRNAAVFGSKYVHIDTLVYLISVSDI